MAEWAHSSSVSARTGELRLRNTDGLARTPDSPFESDQSELQAIIDQTTLLTLNEKGTTPKWPWIFLWIINPLVLTAISAFVRLHGIGASKRVVWDEAHFGKFGSYYIQHEFYFDVHPPLGKLLVGFSGYLAGFDGTFKFESGHMFPQGQNIVFMRVFNCIFGILCTPLAYYTAVELKFSQWTIWCVSLLVAFEMLSLALAKFILLDLMLLLFTVSTFFGIVKVHTLRNGNLLISKRGIFWLAYTGFSIGCVCLVKWVGLFVTILAGTYTVYDLAVRYFQANLPPQRKFKITWLTYLTHWAVRILTLIVIPGIIYVSAFKAHFAMLSKSGPGDGSISTLMQASLEGNTLKNGPRNVAFGSLVTLRSQGLSPNLLHSHSQKYPEGSGQQQVTTYGFKDTNNEFLVEFGVDVMVNEHRYATLDYDEEHPENVLDYTTLLKDGDTLRLSHKQTGAFLHSHPIAAHVLKSHYEATGYGSIDTVDEYDDWVIEIQTQDVSPSPEFRGEDLLVVHPVLTNFRLRHKLLGCYLATTGYSYPAWGFQQGEVVCKKTFLAKDKSTWWNIEDHVNDALESPNSTYVAPKPKFWKEFVLLNYGMMALNNALVPDPDHFDNLALSWWEWPILRTGLRMGSWSTKDMRYFLIGHPFVTFFSTACIPVAAITLVVAFLGWQRQSVDLQIYGEEWGFILLAGILPLAGWFLHYLPFVIMGRVTYLHHYVPALYFAIFVSGFVLEYFVARRAHRYVKYPVFAGVLFCIVYGFYVYHPLAMGMTGPTRNYEHLRLRRTWKI